MYKFAPITEENLHRIASLELDAYPTISYTRNVEQYTESLKEINRRSDVNYHGVYDADSLVGGFNIWDFEMNMRGSMIKAGGLGSVAVDLCRKKEKICFEIMRHFISNLRENGTSIALLYPFNSAFYYKMGFGFGTLLQQFKLRPADLPGGNSKSHISRLTESNAEMLMAYYNSKVRNTHGLITKSVDEFTARLKRPSIKIFAYIDSGTVRGYIACSFKKGNEESFLVNDILVNELLFDSPEVFGELMSFLKSQADQVRYVIINTQDEGFINTIADPRNQTERILFSVYQECCQTGLGIMYRICDVRRFFADIADCRFGNLNMKVQLNVNDSFVPENNKPFMLEFTTGQCVVVNSSTPDVEISIGIAELSSVIMGCSNLKSLVKYGKAHISDAGKLDELSRAFSLDEKPICVTHF